MKRILIGTFAITLSVALAACATTNVGSRDLAGNPKGGESRPASSGKTSSGGGRADVPPAGRNQGPARSQGTVMSSHPSKTPVQNSGGGKDDGHKVVVHNTNTGNDETHKVIVDHRPPSVVSHDPHVRIMRRGNFHPVGNWDHFHPVIIVGYDHAWWGVWGINSWETVGTVTCQAANEATGELYPVTMQRDRGGWDDPSVNNILDQALDDCMAEATVADGAVSPCIASIPACSFESWDGTVYSPN